MYNWLVHVGKFRWLVLLARDYWKNKRAEEDLKVKVKTLSSTAVAGLNPEQKQIYDMFVRHYESYSQWGQARAPTHSGG